MDEVDELEVDEVEELQDLHEANFEGNNENLVDKVEEPKIEMCFNSSDEMFEYSITSDAEISVMVVPSVIVDFCGCERLRLNRD